MLITAIENLTSRALQETGKQWEEMDSNILQSMDTDVHIKDSRSDKRQDDIDSENTFGYNTEKHLALNSRPNSYESSASSTNSIVPVISEISNDEMMEKAEFPLGYKNYDRKYISSNKEINNPVITNISYTNNHIKSETQQIIDNNTQKTENPYRNTNSNNNSNTEIDS